eukprot:1824126-Rhodomonas_salina.2
MSPMTRVWHLYIHHGATSAPAQVWQMQREESNWFSTSSRSLHSQDSVRRISLRHSAPSVFRRHFIAWNMLQSGHGSLRKAEGSGLVLQQLVLGISPRADVSLDKLNLQEHVREDKSPVQTAFALLTDGRRDNTARVVRAEGHLAGSALSSTVAEGTPFKQSHANAPCLHLAHLKARAAIIHPAHSSGAYLSCHSKRTKVIPPVNFRLRALRGLGFDISGEHTAHGQHIARRTAHSEQSNQTYAWPRGKGGGQHLSHSNCLTPCTFTLAMLRELTPDTAERWALPDLSMGVPETAKASAAQAPRARRARERRNMAYMSPVRGIVVATQDPYEESKLPATAGGCVFRQLTDFKHVSSKPPTFPDASAQTSNVQEPLPHRWRCPAAVRSENKRANISLCACNAMVIVAAALVHSAVCLCARSDVQGTQKACLCVQAQSDEHLPFIGNGSFGTKTLFDGIYINMPPSTGCQGGRCQVKLTVQGAHQCRMLACCFTLEPGTAQYVRTVHQIASTADVH